VGSILKFITSNDKYQFVLCDSQEIEMFSGGGEKGKLSIGGNAVLSFGNPGEQVGQPEWFTHYRAAQFLGLRHLFLVDIGGKQKLVFRHALAAALLLEVDEFQAVHDRHIQIGDENVGAGVLLGALASGVEKDRAGRRRRKGKNLVTTPLQQQSEHLPHLIIVLKQNSAGARGHGRYSWLWRVGGRDSRICLGW
jgi:hypothetical protein